MPAYRATTFIPSRVKSQKNTLRDKTGEAKQEFIEGLEETGEYPRIRELGRKVGKYEHKAEDMFKLENKKDSITDLLEQD
ncbi:MAG: hypothetical protein J07AB43_17000 [Candidatus Nanosalina sp. J07AB43]|jgi:hypothetical protein|nr:MAG: hypothetical protein J07AB43_17000 [Candidatus Nanosalina sp. J07AB43]